MSAPDPWKPLKFSTQPSQRLYPDLDSASSTSSKQNGNDQKYQSDLEKALALSLETAETDRLKRWSQEPARESTVRSSTARPRPRSSAAASVLVSPENKSGTPTESELPLIMFSPDSVEKVEKFKNELKSLTEKGSYQQHHPAQLNFAPPSPQSHGIPRSMDNNLSAFGGSTTSPSGMAQNNFYIYGRSSPQPQQQFFKPFQHLEEVSIAKPSSSPNLQALSRDNPARWSSGSSSSRTSWGLVNSSHPPQGASCLVSPRQSAGNPLNLTTTTLPALNPMLSRSDQSLNSLSSWDPQSIHSNSNSAVSSTSEQDTLNKIKNRNRISNSADLMEFGDDITLPKHNEFSWESFDPLYSLTGNMISAEQGPPVTLPRDAPKEASDSDNKDEKPKQSKSHTYENVVLDDLAWGGASETYRALTDSVNFEGLSCGEYVPDFDLQDPFSITELSRVQESKKKKDEKRKDDEPDSTFIRKEVVSVTMKEVASEKPPRPPKPQYLKYSQNQVSISEKSSFNAEDETQAFYNMVKRLKAEYLSDDIVSNPGIVISAMDESLPLPDNMSVKVVVETKLSKEPVVFTCNVKTSVEHVIGHVLCSVCEEGRGYSVSAEDYLVKVHDLSEYFVNDSVFGDYEYVQRCIKLDEDIRLIMVKLEDLTKQLARVPLDDRKPLVVHRPETHTRNAVSQDHLKILLETFDKEVEKIRAIATEKTLSKLQPKNLIQAVHAVCAILFKLETNSITKAIARMTAVAESWHEALSLPEKEVQMDELASALDELTVAVHQVVKLYCKMYYLELPPGVEKRQCTDSVTMDVTGILENMIVHIASVHRIPEQWKNSYDHYSVIASLYYAGRKLCQDVMTPARSCTSDKFHTKVVWDDWLQFSMVPMCTLPRETRLILHLCACKNVSNDSSTQVKTSLGWVAVQLFDFKRNLVQGSQLLPLWPGDPKPLGTNLQNTIQMDSLLLQVTLPDLGVEVEFPNVIHKDLSERRDFDSLHPDTQEELMDIVEKDSLSRLTDDEKEVIWEKRHYLYQLPNALPKVLMAAHSWDWACLADTYSMIYQWAPLGSVEAMQLLLPQFVDEKVRDVAVKWMREISSDELCNFLPQLVQALKFENYSNTSLVHFLLDRAVTSIRVAHNLFWLLKEAASDLFYRSRYQLVFGALMSVAGEALCTEFQKQEELARKLGEIADKVKIAKDKDATLGHELEPLYQILHDTTTMLPLNPSMEVVGLDIRTCSYFTSNAFPLKLVFKNVEPTAASIDIMFKSGDDIRQDMLTMQLVRIMDKLWMREGLDLKIITFMCVPTASKKGMVELVTECETLRKIQVSAGVTGSFKDRPIADWLKKHNPTELEFRKAVSNFTLSCAGYCVATYILGICDRHNDNIMLKQSGHMFHIDFGKFMGDSQMFGTIKRDRVPFVLTSDMAYVINGGDKPSQKFQEFIDLCCQAFNILRRHGNHLVTLIRMMEYSGIPGVTVSAAKYVQKALLPECSDAEATAMFTRMIEESLRSVFTQINFFVHNLAQLKFRGHTEGELLSFSPKTYSVATDGKIGSVEIFGYQKRYSPEKFYIYIIKVGRQNQKVPNFVFRKYTEFQEFHNKLVTMFPLAKLPSLQGRVLMGRTHVKSVAKRRKIELEHFLRELLQMATEISECDLVYTFFHPMLRDEQDIDSTNLQKLKEAKPTVAPVRLIHGQIKMSLQYKNGVLSLMIMHVKDLAKESGELPDPYVKTYLLPDPNKITKRKTKIAHGTFHPTYNEMLLYRIPEEEVKQRVLQVTIWNYDVMKENEFLGSVLINLNTLDLSKENVNWYQLEKLLHWK
ncbi:phosphatidylinositol 4-phosphate 3-kinase C2 domain-containing subunit alpha-like [Lingula anatina]|uniref:Phosphatidylinositol 4-phosphate 3-kinase C2 domain-containing subunit alpha-like n=1 Tax=Lingula anatina TaxID=7574 RepID=A0A1S3JCP9_LINAN|nr:phosphatidylinositol 4-phosphate 3-kinase C2 domain-containing subunit alpha-like [Lingula anatina]|eukprot:XP_013408190.1 phosphatidylinositol 4-phosphate 3-kinase C2 domain-containing subunit alpha-like [Lingula anatina]